MEIKVNGDSRTVDNESISVAELLVVCGVENPDMVSVQLNQQFVEKNQYPTTAVSQDDEVDFLYYMGGGR